MSNINKTQNSDLFVKIKTLVDKTKGELAVKINEELNSMYWQIGNYINAHILQSKRADYGKEVIKELSKKLSAEYGSGWSEKQLRHYMRFAEIFDIEIVYTLCRQLTWSNIRKIMYIDDKLKRDFYVQMAIHERWSFRTLKSRIDSMLFERTALSKKPDELIRQEIDKLQNETKYTPDLVFKDPYFLNFLDLKSTYSEKDLEQAIIGELKDFLIELGSYFTFVGSQKRITIDHEDYYMDLVFYHRKLRCQVVIELKLGDFKAEYKGKMELYLRWIEKYDLVEHENPPIGLILCAGKNEEHVELLQLDKSNIRVATYLTELPPKKIMEDRLRKAIERAKNRLK